MLERDIEDHLVVRCKQIGALCDKFCSPQRRAVPDRIVTFEGCVYFIELKALGKQATAPQQRDHARRRKVGATVLVLNSLIEVEAFVQSLEADREARIALSKLPFAGLV